MHHNILQSWDRNSFCIYKTVMLQYLWKFYQTFWLYSSARWSLDGISQGTQAFVKFWYKSSTLPFKKETGELMLVKDGLQKFPFSWIFFCFWLLFSVFHTSTRIKRQKKGYVFQYTQMLIDIHALNNQDLFNLHVFFLLAYTSNSHPTHTNTLLHRKISLY